MLRTLVLAPVGPGPGRVRVDLDVAADTFLADHRVGASALLSTVMGVEAMSAAVALLTGSTVRAVRDVVVHPPLLVADDRPCVVVVAVEPTAGQTPDLFACRLSSALDGERVHYEATVAVGPPLDGGPWTASGSEPDRPFGGVDAADIYRLYFHGPSFRVLRGARLDARSVSGLLAEGSPPLGAPPEPSTIAPLLIELCLQTAGLWELEESGRMMIPESIDEIVRHSTVEHDSGVRLRAVVERSATAVGGEDRDATGGGFDAKVIDDAGRTHLEVRGYRTAELGQPVDPAAASAVVAALRAGRAAGS